MSDPISHYLLARVVSHDRHRVRKVVIHRAGGYERLAVEEHPTPEPGVGEVRVAVAAAGVNFADCVVRMGLYAAAREYAGWPITPGFELAGHVSALGHGVRGLREGDPVVGVTRFGAYATEVVMTQEQLFPLPGGAPLVEAAGFPVVFLTAWHAVRELAPLRPGMSVLVHSAAGGVGGALLQLGRLAGARMVGIVGSSHKIEAARSLGADAVIDKGRERLWPRAEEEAPRGYDVVLDANGAETLAEGFRHLAPSGRLIVYGFHGMLVRGRGRPSWPRLLLQYLRTPRFNPLTMTTTNRGVLGFNLAFLFDRREALREAMEELLSLLAAGRIRLPPTRSFPLDRVADAHRALEAGNTIGKLVLAT